MTRPFGLTNEPDPPSLNRTLESRMCSSHCAVGVKLYLSFNCLTGGLSNVHIPSSAAAVTARVAKRTSPRMGKNIPLLCEEGNMPDLPSRLENKKAPTCFIDHLCISKNYDSI